MDTHLFDPAAVCDGCWDAYTTDEHEGLGRLGFHRYSRYAYYAREGERCYRCGEAALYVTTIDIEEVSNG